MSTEVCPTCKFVNFQKTKPIKCNAWDSCLIVIRTRISLSGTLNKRPRMEELGSSAIARLSRWVHLRVLSTGTTSQLEETIAIWARPGPVPFAQRRMVNFMPRGIMHRVRDIQACGAHGCSMTAKAVNETPHISATSARIGGQE